MVRLSRVMMPPMAPLVKRSVKISPFDPLVQQAYNEVQGQLPDVDVIKIEPTCPANIGGFVSNVDLLRDRQRVIHLCLNNIKSRFRQMFDQKFNVTNPNLQQKIKEAIKAELVHRILPHEGVHIDQEVGGQGQFGPSPELKAEQAEHPEKAKAELEKIILKKATDTYMLAVRAAADKKDIKTKFDIKPMSCFLVVDPKDDEGYIRYTDKDIPDKFKKYKCTLIEFPKLRQAFQYSCGASAAQMIMEFYGYDENEKAIMESLKTKESGTTIDPVVRYFKKKGFKVEDGEGTVDDIKKWIDKCVPVILTIQAWGDEDKKSYKGYKDGHYVVAVGYTDEHIVFSDPSSVYGAYLTYDELDKRWHDIDEDASDKIEHYMVVPHGKDPVYEPYRVMPLE